MSSAHRPRTTYKEKTILHILHVYTSPNHGSSVLWYWPVIHVTHSHLSTHLTHDPWPVDQLSALQCGICDRIADRPSVCLSIRRPPNAWSVPKRKKLLPIFLYRIWKADTSVDIAIRRMVGEGHSFCLKFWAKLTHPFKNVDFQSIFACSASTVTRYTWQKINLSLIGAFNEPKWTTYVTPKPPKWVSKQQWPLIA